MRRPRRSSADRARRIVCGAMVLAVALTACDGSVKTGDESLLPERERQNAPPDPTASPDPVDRPTPSEEPVPDEGTLEVRVQDETGRPRPDVRVLYAGPDTGSAVTDVDGRARIPKLTPGAYEVEVRAGCIGFLEINQGRRSQATVFAGKRSVVVLNEIAARRRYWGGTPVTWSPEQPWPRGERVTLRFLLFDRCKGVDAPNKRLRGLRLVASDSVTLLRADDRSRDDAIVEVRLRCHAAGPGKLSLVDDDTGEAIELIGLRGSFGPPADACA